MGPPTWSKRAVEEIIAMERIVDFDPSDMMTLSFLKKYHLERKARPDRHFINVTSIIVELVSNGLGYTVLSQDSAASHLASGKLVDLMPGKYFEYQLGLSW